MHTSTDEHRINDMCPAEMFDHLTADQQADVEQEFAVRWFEFADGEDCRNAAFGLIAPGTQGALAHRLRVAWVAYRDKAMCSEKYAELVGLNLERQAM